jgi:hypothetical protein
MALRKVLGIGNRAARRHGQDRFTITRMNPKRVSSRAAMPTQANGEDLRAVLDGKSRRFGWPPIKKRAKGHVYGSGGKKFARILP